MNWALIHYQPKKNPDLIRKSSHPYLIIDEAKGPTLGNFLWVRPKISLKGQALGQVYTILTAGGVTSTWLGNFLVYILKKKKTNLLI